MNNTEQVKPSGQTQVSESSYNKRRLKNLLLTPKFQLRYVLFVLVSLGALATLLGYLTWRQSRRASEFIAEEFTSMNDLELSQWVAANLHDADNHAVVIIALIAIVGILLLTIYSVVLTHRIVGPLYRMRQYFEEVENHQLGDLRPLREGDFGEVLFDAFQKMHQSRRAAFVEDNRLIRKFVSECELAVVNQENGKEVVDLELLERAKTFCEERETLLHYQSTNK